MSRSALFAVSLAVIISLSACAGRGVDEELLPTLVPTLDAQALVAAALAARPTQAPTATDTPQPPTPEPAPTAADTPEPATAEPEPAAPSGPPSSAVIEYGGVSVSASDEVTATEDLTQTADAAATDVITDTEELTAADIDSTAVVTGTEVAEATEPAPATEPAAEPELPEASAPISDTDSLTGTVTTTEPVAEVAAEAATEAVEATEQPTLEAAAALPTATATPEPTPAPKEPAEDEQANVDPALVGMPEDLLAAMADADPDNGEMLTLSTGCTGCHSLDPNQFMAGPTWYNMAETAANRVEGESAGLYLYHSIVEPNAYVVENFQPNIMLQIYNDTISQDDMADIVAYLLTIRGR